MDESKAKKLIVFNLQGRVCNRSDTDNFRQKGGRACSLLPVCYLDQHIQDIQGTDDGSYFQISEILVSHRPYLKLFMDAKILQGRSNHTLCSIVQYLVMCPIELRCTCIRMSIR